MPAPKKPSKTRRIYAKAKGGYHRAKSKGFLGMPKIGSMKELAAGTLGLVAMKRYQPFGGVYKPAVDKVAAGIALNAVKLGNSDLVSAGLKEGLATLADSYLGGFLGGSLGTSQSGGDSL